MAGNGFHLLLIEQLGEYVAFSALILNPRALSYLRVFDQLNRRRGKWVEPAGIEILASPDKAQPSLPPVPEKPQQRPRAGPTKKKSHPG